MTKLTEEEYLKSKMTTWDNICWYSWVPTFLLVVVSIIVVAMVDASYNAERMVAILFAISFAFTVTLRTLLANKIDRWKDEYKHLVNDD